MLLLLLLYQHVTIIIMPACYYDCFIIYVLGSVVYYRAKTNNVRGIFSVHSSLVIDSHVPDQSLAMLTHHPKSTVSIFFRLAHKHNTNKIQEIRPSTEDASSLSRLAGTLDRHLPRRPPCLRKSTHGIRLQQGQKIRPSTIIILSVYSSFSNQPQSTFFLLCCIAFYI